jgi:fucose permease
MTRLLLIFILLTQMGCSVLQTAVGTFVGTLTSEVVRNELDKDDEEAPQP